MKRLPMMAYPEHRERDLDLSARERVHMVLGGVAVALVIWLAVLLISLVPTP